MEALRNACKDAALIVENGACTAVHRLRSLDHFSTEEVSHALQPEAYSENRQPRFENDPPADPKVPLVFGTAWPGGNDDVVDAQVLKLLPRQFVIADHQRLHAVDGRHQMEQVERERVVVIDNKRLYCPHSRMILQVGPGNARSEAFLAPMARRMRLPDLTNAVQSAGIEDFGSRCPGAPRNRNGSDALRG